MIMSRNFENLKRKLQELINDIDECSTSQQSAPQPSTSGQSDPAASFATRAADNFRRAFPALSRPPGGRPVARRRETCTATRNFVVRNTFTATFCCLKSTSTVSPNANEMHQLSCQGLGKKRHTFDKDGDHSYLQNELEKLFPKLKAAKGKFQLYKSLGGGSGRRQLHKIPMGPAGYSIKWLCENVVIGSASIYVVPLLSLPDAPQQDVVNLIASDMPKVKCESCQEEVGLNVYEDHKCQKTEKNAPPLTASKTTPSHSAVTQVQDSNATQLKEMFPNMSDVQIIQALDSCETIDECVSSLLDSSSEKVTEVSEDKPKDLEGLKGLTGERILEIYRQSVVKVPGPTYPITFNRSKSKMKELVRIYKMAASKLDRPPVLYFVSEGGNDEDDLIEEDAADVGGPLREFFYIATETLMSCTNPHMFEGDHGHKVPVHSQQLVLQGLFKMAGQAFAHAIIHGKFSIVGLARPVVVFLETGCMETACSSVTMEDVPDLEVKKMLRDIMEADDEHVMKLQADDAVINLMIQCGVSASLLSKNNATGVAYECMVYQVVQKRFAELKQLRDGLNVLGLLQLLENHPKVSREIFHSPDEAIVQFDVLKCRVKRDPCSPMGTNADQAFQFLLQYLEETCQRESGITIKDVLVFITRSPLMPAEITVKFSESDVQQLPDPNTCSTEVLLPICHFAYDDFRRAFDSAIKIQGKGYGRA